MKQIQRILKLVGLETYAIKTYFILLGIKYGVNLTYTKNKITVTDKKRKRQIIVSIDNLPYLIDIIRYFSYYFEMVKSDKNEFGSFVDYSASKLHTLSQSGIEFLFSSFPESDDVTELYIGKSHLHAGDIVIDFGSFCGSTVYSFSKKVGPTGKVFAFEPDEKNYEALIYNIKKHNLTNVQL